MYGCGEQEVGVASGSGWNLWVWLQGVVVRSLILICSFLQQHPYFLFILYIYSNQHRYLFKKKKL